MLTTHFVRSHDPDALSWGLDQSLRNRLIGHLVDAAIPDEPISWGDEAGFGSEVDPDEYAADNVYKVISLVGYGDEYVDSYAHELRNFMDIMDLHIRPAQSANIVHQANHTNVQVPIRRAGDGTGDLIFDTGASASFTNDFADFIEEPEEINEPSTGFTGSSVATARGMVTWHVVDQHGDVHALTTPAVYVPNGTRRLFSPQAHFQYQQLQNINVAVGYMTINECCMEFQDRSGWKITQHISPDENLPVTPLTNSPESRSMQLFNTVLADQNRNLTAAQKVLLLWHQKLGHTGFQWVQSLMRLKPDGEEPCINPGTSRAQTIDPPRCEACEYARQGRRGTGHHEIHRPGNEMALRNGDLRPGQCIAGDHYVSPVKGRLPHTRGREPDREKYCGGSIFVDHASVYIFLEHQRSLGATDTLRAKRKFEQMARASGVHVERYHTDNGIFSDDAFREEVELLGQEIDFSGVGAHHQNGVAERAIKTVTERARALMLHAALHWPNEAHTDLWPFAMSYVVYLWNRTPNQISGLSPQEIFCGTRQVCTTLRNAKVWGCPTYVLDPTLQDHKKIPKWKPRSRRGQFLGFSSEHASSIGLIRNLRTGHVSPQYHVVTDDKFTTVARDDDEVVDLQRWYDLVTNHRDYYPDEDDLPPELGDDWLDELELQAREAEQTRVLRAPRPAPIDDPGALPVVERQNEEIQDDDEDGIFNGLPDLDESSISSESSGNSPENEASLASDAGAPVEHEIVFEPASDDEDDADSLFPDDDSLLPEVLFPEDELIFGRAPEPAARRRNPDRVLRGRNRRYEQQDQDDEGAQQPRRNPNRALKGRNRKYEEAGYSQSYGRTLHAGDRALLFHDRDDLNCETCPKLYTSTSRTLWYLAQITSDQDNGLLHFHHPLAFATKAQDEDLPTWDMAMNSPEAEQFWDAMDLEIQQLGEKDAWITVDRSVAIDIGQRILGSTWAFRKKRFPDGRLKKIKARICVRGDQQVKGVDVFDTFSPVVQWATVRLMLILSVALNLETQQVDYANAFVQAELEKPVFMEMPRGYRQTGKILQLQRSVYGLWEAPLNWYNKLCGGLKDRGFVCSEHDPCLFVHKAKKMICISWVDDCLFFAYDGKHIDDMITSLKTDFEVDRESDVAGFLGLELKRHENGTIEILQTGLIDRILTSLGLETANGKATPAEAAPIGMDEDGEPRKDEWNYSSVIGMLLYLQSNSRPDLTYAVSQCARFSRHPTALHEGALKRIGRYLKQTRDHGMIIDPARDLKLDMYCDADFAGLWRYEDIQDPTCVKSRTGYIMTLGNAPVIWHSKLQTEVALSTMEAEYIALSAGMKELVPLRRLLGDILEVYDVQRDDQVTVSTVFEDNASCLILANTPPPRMTPRSKHIAIKYHWFRDKVQEGEIEVVKIDTKAQKADIFTKGLRTDAFESIRKLIMGW